MKICEPTQTNALLNTLIWFKFRFLIGMSKTDRQGVLTEIHLEVFLLIFFCGEHYDIETNPLICRANQWIWFYMIGNSVINQLIYLQIKLLLINLQKEEDSFKVRFKPPEVPIDNQLLLTKWIASSRIS